LDAVCDQPKKKKLVIPKFQRKRAWDIKKENELIDSLEKKYPVGSLTLYKIPKNTYEEYVLFQLAELGYTAVQVSSHLLLFVAKFVKSPNTKALVLLL
jgi:hypothetical protein